jgi:hypothetical protein
MKNKHFDFYKKYFGKKLPANSLCSIKHMGLIDKELFDIMRPICEINDEDDGDNPEYKDTDWIYWGSGKEGESSLGEFTALRQTIVLFMGVIKLNQFENGKKKTKSR